MILPEIWSAIRCYLIYSIIIAVVFVLYAAFWMWRDKDKY